MVIYKLTFPNGKVYIGRAIDFENRMCTHKYAAYSNRGKTKIYNAIRKYGWDLIVKEVIYTCSSKEEMILKEREYIEQFDSYKNGYNSSLLTEDGGDIWEGKYDGVEYQKFVERMKIVTTGEKNGMFNRQHTTDTKEKMSNKSKGRHTLQWFIDKFGDEVGGFKYYERNKKLSDDRKQENNSQYIHVDYQQLLKDIIKYDEPLRFFAKKHNVKICKIQSICKCKLGSTFKDLKIKYHGHWK